MASNSDPVTLSVIRAAPSTQTPTAAPVRIGSGHLAPSNGKVPVAFVGHGASSDRRTPGTTASSGIYTAAAFAAIPAPAAAVTPAATTQPKPAPAAASGSQPDLQTLAAQLNKHLNDSGRPDQYRVDPQSGTMIQEVNPATGAVIGEFAASEFPTLARSVGASGLLINSLA
jgi:hypothetical protein